MLAIYWEAATFNGRRQDLPAAPPRRPLGPSRYIQPSNVLLLLWLLLQVPNVCLPKRRPASFTWPSESSQEHSVANQSNSIAFYCKGAKKRQSDLYWNGDCRWLLLWWVAVRCNAAKEHSVSQIRVCVIHMLLDRPINVATFMGLTWWGRLPCRSVTPSPLHHHHSTTAAEGPFYYYY